MKLKTRTALCIVLLLISGDFSKAKLLQAPQSIPFYVPFTDRAAEGETLRMLNAMEQLMEGGTEFDPVFYPKLEQCWNTLSPDLKAAQDNAWAGMLQYSDDNGSAGDEWGSCFDMGHCSVYFEQNATQQEYHNMTIYEPCNYASNVAYYHTTTEVCANMGNWNFPDEVVQALGEVMSSLAMGSAFWHGSHTYVGNVADNRFIEVLAFILHQTAVGNLNTTSSVILDLSETPRAATGIELNAQLTDMFLNTPVDGWAEIILSFDMPSYYTGFAGLVGTVITLVLDDAAADELIEKLIALFKLPEEEAEFMVDKYIPELRVLLDEHEELTVIEKAQLETNFLSAAIKMIYAFLWQEWAVTSNPIIYEPWVNELGAEYIPTVNAFANALNNWPEYDTDLQNSINIYPGDTTCNPQYPHTKWHQESAAGLTDLIYLVDDIYRLTTV